MCYVRVYYIREVFLAYFPDSQVLHVTEYTIQHLELAGQTGFSYAGRLPQCGSYLLSDGLAAFVRCAFCFLLKNPSIFDSAINQVELSTFTC